MSRLRRGRAMAVSGSLVVAFLLSGCALLTSSKSSNVDAAEVEYIDLYEYTWGSKGSGVDHVRIDAAAVDQEVVEELVRMFVDMPVTALQSDDRDRAGGSETLAVRYTLQGGATVEATRILVGLQDALVIWPDGDANRTTWGAPRTFAYYSEFGEPGEVDAADMPAAEIVGGG